MVSLDDSGTDKAAESEKRHSLGDTVVSVQTIINDSYSALDWIVVDW